MCPEHGGNGNGKEMIALKDIVRENLSVLGDWYLYRVQRNGGIEDNSKILTVGVSWRIIMNNTIPKLRKSTEGAVWGIMHSVLDILCFRSPK